MIDYDPHRWRDHLFDLKGSMLRQIAVRVFGCVAWSALVVYFHTSHAPLGISDRAHLLVGTALGLLLVFRTNASYDRYWDGRKQWGTVMTAARNLGRAASVLLRPAPDAARRVLGWAIVFPSALAQLLRDRPGFGSAPAWLPPDEVQAARHADHAPLAVARRISAQLAEARRAGVISEAAQLNLDQHVHQLIDAAGGCERIRCTPLPFAYVVHLRRCLLLYCLTLPFALLELFGWWTVPVTLLVGYLLLGIEEIGVEIEDPFGFDENDLPLDRLCATVERNLLELLPAEHAEPERPLAA